MILQRLDVQLVEALRSPSIGLYSQLRRIEGLPYPEAVFDGGFFRSNPKPFYTLVRQIYPQRLCPTDTHKFFKVPFETILTLALSGRVTDYNPVGLNSYPNSLSFLCPSKLEC